VPGQHIESTGNRKLRKVNWSKSSQYGVIVRIMVRVRVSN